MSNWAYPFTLRTCMWKRRDLHRTADGIPCNKTLLDRNMLSIVYSGHRVHQKRNEIPLQGCWYGQRKEKVSSLFHLRYSGELDFCILSIFHPTPMNERCVGVPVVLKSTKLEEVVASANFIRSLRVTWILVGVWRSHPPTLGRAVIPIVRIVADSFMLTAIYIRSSFHPTAVPFKACCFVSRWSAVRLEFGFGIPQRAKSE